GAGDAAAGGVRRGDGLIARRLQGDAEGPVAGGQGHVPRQHRLTVAAGEVNRAAVARRRVVIRIQGGDGEAEGAARRGAGRSADRVVRGGRGADRDGVARSGNTVEERIRGGEGLA